jgi:hypothetical protein
MMFMQIFCSSQLSWQGSTRHIEQGASLMHIVHILGLSYAIEGYGEHGQQHEQIGGHAREVY